MTPELQDLIRLLAEIAVDQFLDERGDDIEASDIELGKVKSARRVAEDAA